jgi:hypothetical protein
MRAVGPAERRLAEEKCQDGPLGKEIKLCGLSFLTRCVPNAKSKFEIRAQFFRARAYLKLEPTFRGEDPERRGSVAAGLKPRPSTGLN